MCIRRPLIIVPDHHGSLYPVTELPAKQAISRRLHVSIDNTCMAMQQSTPSLSHCAAQISPHQCAQYARTPFEMCSPVHGLVMQSLPD